MGPHSERESTKRATLPASATGGSETSARASLRGGLSELPRKPQEPGRRSGSSPFRAAGHRSRSETDLVRARSGPPRVNPPERWMSLRPSRKLREGWSRKNARPRGGRVGQKTTHDLISREGRSDNNARPRLLEVCEEAARLRLGEGCSENNARPQLVQVWSMILALVLLFGLRTDSRVSANDEVDLTTLSYAEVVSSVQPRMVKVFGSGGLRGLESYQSGFLISAEGHVLTSWSYVLDSGEATVVLNDGRKFVSTIVGADPGLELAVLKVDAAELPYFDLNQATTLRTGSRVLAFSNLYGVATGDEPASVLHGIVSAVTKLSARRGVFQTPYRGTVYVLDAMTNNAGAAGGALTDSQGRLAAVLGKELRDAEANTWLNYALPIDEIRASVANLVAGKMVDSSQQDRRPEEAASLEGRGVVLIPNVLRNTPPFVDMVLPNSSAEKAGLRPDDLIVLVNGQAVASQSSVRERMLDIDAVDPVRLTVTRDSELVEIEVQP